MTVKITYRDGQSYTSSQEYTYTENAIIFTFVFPQQQEEPCVIESTAQILPLTEEVQA